LVLPTILTKALKSNPWLFIFLFLLVFLSLASISVKLFLNFTGVHLDKVTFSNSSTVTDVYSVCAARLSYACYI
jgi:hypothetical protein